MLLLRLSLLVLVTQATRHIRVSHDGFNSSHCWNQQRGCATIELALAGLQASESANTSINIQGAASAYTLPADSNTTVLIGAQNVAITGSGDEEVTVECEQGAGLALINSANVSISQLTLTGCGLFNKHVQSQRPSYSSALLFSDCSDVAIINVSISNSTGVGTIMQDSSGVVQIRNSVYTSNNGNVGGILITQSVDSPVLYLITGCLFENNTAKGRGLVYSNSPYPSTLFPSRGGGLMVSLDPSSSLFLDSCSFISNTAQYGGSVYLELSGTATVNITDCSFENTTAYTGSALYITSCAQLPRKTFPSCVMLSNVEFYNCSVGFHKNSVTGIGAVYSNGVPLCLSQEVIFTNNSGTALAMSGAPAIVVSNSTVDFTSNSGHNGGALALLNRAHLLVHSGSTFSFVNNVAHLYGGAIYNDHYSLKMSMHGCFVQHTNTSLDPNDWNVSFVFEDNYANNQPNSIYSPSILSCVWPHISSTAADVHATLCWTGWQYLSSNCSQNIRTAPADYTQTENEHTSKAKEATITTFPGHNNKLPFTFVDDEFNDITSDVVLSTIFDKNDTFVDHYTSDKTVTLYGEPRTGRTLTLDTLRPRVLQVKLMVNFTQCPPGFDTNQTAVGGRYNCSCAGHFDSSVICDGEAFQAYLQWGRILSYNESSDLVLAGAWRVHAPPPGVGERIRGFFSLPNDTPTLNRFFCSNLSRHGFLCADCDNGTSAPIYDYDYKCVSCTDSDVRVNWLIFIVLQILPVTILFLVVTIFNINATSGPLNAFIFYSQVISSPTTAANFLAQLTFVFRNSPIVAKLILIVFVYPYGIWNLDCFPVLILIPPFCLFQNMKAVHAFVLNYLVAACYPLLLIGFLFICVELHAHGCRPLVWVWQRFGYCLGRWRRNWDVRTTIIDAFATFLLLTYTKFCFLSFYLLVPMNLYSSNGTIVGQPRLYFDPSVKFGDTEHIPFICLSLFILVFVIILPPIFLLLYPFTVFQKFLTKLRIKGHTLGTFVEAFQGCYKDGTNGTPDCRYFAALYFFLRIVAFSSTVFAYDLAMQRLVQVIIIYIIVMVFGVAQPYKVMWYNRLDVFIFTVLGVVASFGFYNAVITNNNLVISVIMMISVIIPLIYFILLVSHRIYVGVKHYWSRSRERRSTFRETQFEQEDGESYKENEPLFAELSTDSLPDRMVNPKDYDGSTLSQQRPLYYGSMLNANRRRY